MRMNVEDVIDVENDVSLRLLKMLKLL